MKSRVILASALLAALVIPALAVSNPTQSASITITSAVGSTAGDALSFGSSAPSATDGNATNITSSSTTAFNGFSNKANWTSQVKLTNASTTARLRSATTDLAGTLSIASACGGSFSALTTTNQSFVTAGSKNSSNSGQAVPSCYRQAVSWTDDPGTYSGTVTHTLAAAP